jgi:hypothetical protein
LVRKKELKKWFGTWPGTSFRLLSSSSCMRLHQKLIT